MDRDIRFVDAAMQLPANPQGSWETVLFRGPRCLQLDWDRGIAYLGDIPRFQKMWDTLPPGFTRDLDAALRLPEGPGGSWRTMLFKGPDCVVVDSHSGVGYQGRITGCEGMWRNLPAEFAHDLDAVLPLPGDRGRSWQVMLFKGADCVIVDSQSGVGYQGRITGYGRMWEALPSSFASDVDAVLQLPCEPRTGPRTMLFKGPDCLVLDQEIGVCYHGSVTSCTPKWPDAYRALTGMMATARW